MPAENQQDAPITPWDGLATTLIHDVGKVAELTTLLTKLRQEGQSISHSDLRKIVPRFFKEFQIHETPQIPGLWYGLIEKRFDLPAAQFVRDAHKLGDQISKQIQGPAYSELEPGGELDKSDPDAANKLKRDKLPTHFFPYWGLPQLWDSAKADRVFQNVCGVIAKAPTLRALLSLQDAMEEFPHTRYVPHLSLKLHDKFAASLFYFIYRKLRELPDEARLTEFDFCAIEVSPDLLDVFYRLRDILACSKQASAFYKQVVAELFVPWQRDLPGLCAEDNPFVFYESQGFVFLYPSPAAARSGIQTALDAIPLLRKVEVRYTQFHIDIEYHENRRRPGCARAETFTESVPAPSLADFITESGQRCELCQRIVSATELAADNKESLLCEQCRVARQHGSGIDLDLVSRAGTQSNRIAYIFVTLPKDLRTHAAQVAETKLIPDFWLEHHLPPAYQIPATEQHVYEYLQALLAIRQFDVALKEGVEVIRQEHGQNAAALLFQNPSSKALVVHEDYFWELIDFVHGQKQKLRLECSVRAVICPPKTPFWSLVELATQYRVGDILWDVSREVIHMFSDTEIASIRNLASLCKKLRILRNQLNALSAVALQTSLEELILEIDNRKDRLGELRVQLTKDLRALAPEGSDLQDREKRAVFFKYIAGLTR